jgi:ribonucleoside-diphosphate reductase alpha chain
VLDALFAKKSPRPIPTAPCLDGRRIQLQLGRRLVLILKELVLPTAKRLLGVDGRRLSTRAGRLLKLLSLDMRVIDPAWIGMKLKLLSYAEPLEFHGAGTGAGRQENFLPASPWRG